MPTTPSHEEEAKIILGKHCSCGCVGCRGSLDEIIRGLVEPSKQEHLLDKISSALSEAERRTVERIKKFAGDEPYVYVPDLLKILEVRL